MTRQRAIWTAATILWLALAFYLMASREVSF